MTLNETLLEVDIESISVNPYQPRRNFSESELEELAASIVAVGLIHPPIVQPLPNENKYELISGERRWRAAKLARLKKIPVIIRNQNQTLSAQVALIENIQRIDLNPIDIAQALRTLLETFGLNQEELALRVGKKRSTIANYLRLLSLPKHLQEAVAQENISMGHAKAILSIGEPSTQELLYKRIVGDGLSVRATEELAHCLSQKLEIKPRPKGSKDLHSDQIAQLIQQKLGTKVTITGKGQGGKITIDYYALDDLDRLLSLLSIDV